MAADKKHNARFCLQFDPDDLQQQPVIQLLNELGRGEKSAFIAKAVLHYISCQQVPASEVSFPLPHDVTYVITQSQIEAIVKDVFSRMGPPTEFVSLPADSKAPSDSDGLDAAILNAADIFNF
ncbi:MAG: hypothetical protein ACLVJ7_12215 [Acutalibacteraceae bacterium]